MLKTILITLSGIVVGGIITVIISCLICEYIYMVILIGVSK